MLNLQACRLDACCMFRLCEATAYWPGRRKRVHIPVGHVVLFFFFFFFRAFGTVGKRHLGAQQVECFCLASPLQRVSAKASRAEEAAVFQLLRGQQFVRPLEGDGGTRRFAPFDSLVRFYNRGLRGGGLNIFSLPDFLSRTLRFLGSPCRSGKPSTWTFWPSHAGSETCGSAKPRAMPHLQRHPGTSRHLRTRTLGRS